MDEPLPSCGANASTQPGTENFYGEVMVSMCGETNERAERSGQ